MALRDVAVDLCTIAKGLDASAFIDSNDIESVSESPFWLAESWLDAFTDRHIPLHTPDAVRAIIDLVGTELDAEPTEFYERSSAAVKMALFASGRGLKSLARKELSRGVSCLLGYGSHKDIFASEVLDSLELLASRGVPKARNAILELAGEFEAITDYTDGDETDHVREGYYESIARHFPDRVPTCYAHLIRSGEWRYAEALAIAFAVTEEVESESGQALLETYIAPSEVRALCEGSTSSRPYTKAALERVQTKIGRERVDTCEGEGSALDGDVSSVGLAPTNVSAESSLNLLEFRRVS